MTRQKSSARSVVMMGMLILGSLVVSANSAFAMVQYKVWYFDNNFDWFQEGDVSVGGVKLNPPAWACTLRFYNPSYYRWVDGDENTISSEDFYQDVRVHLPRPGCPESEVVVKLLDGIVIEREDEDGDPIYPSYIEISTNGAINWLDADGSNHACGFACVAPVGFKYLKFKYTGNVVLSSIEGVQGTMLDLQRQARVLDAVAGLRRQVSHLDAETRGQVMARRRHALGDREASVRALEDAALSRLAEAGRKLLECEDRAREWHFTEAFVAGELGSEQVAAVQSLLEVAERSFPPRAQ